MDFAAAGDAGSGATLAVVGAAGAGATGSGVSFASKTTGSEELELAASLTRESSLSTLHSMGAFTCAVFEGAGDSTLEELSSTAAGAGLKETSSGVGATCALWEGEFGE